MRFRLSWVSVAVGLLAAVLFLVPTASRFDVREVVLADGTVNKQLVTGYISLGSVVIGHVFRGTSRLDQVSIALGVVIAAACALLVELGVRGLRRLLTTARRLPDERRGR
jgi:uncharacterized integral membrane protein